MAAGSSARRHAQAVFQIARDQDRLDKWLEDLDELASAFGDPDLRRVLDSPKVRPDQKQELAAQRLAGLDTLARNLASFWFPRAVSHWLKASPRSTGNLWTTIGESGRRRLPPPLPWTPMQKNG